MCIGKKHPANISSKASSNKRPKIVVREKNLSFKPTISYNIMLNEITVNSLAIRFQEMFPKSQLYTIEISEDKKSIIGSVSFNCKENFIKDGKEYLYLSDIQNNTKNTEIVYHGVGRALFLSAQQLSKHFGFEGRLSLDAFKASQGFFDRMGMEKVENLTKKPDPLTRYIFNGISPKP